MLTEKRIAMNDEYAAWQDVVKELRRLKIDINEEDNLCKLINWWGVKLVELKMLQSKPLGE